VRAAPAVRKLYLFLYADAGGGVPTSTEWRDISTSPGRPYEAIAIAPARLPRLTYYRTGPYEFKTHVVNARKPFLLVANETYSTGWSIETKGGSSEDVKHIRVNGYANGWRIPWTGTYDITITYGPERIARLARRFDAILIPFSLVFWLAWRRGGPRRDHRRGILRRTQRGRA
jgi:hypothetical protein